MRTYKVDESPASAGFDTKTENFVIPNQRCLSDKRHMALDTKGKKSFIFQATIWKLQGMLSATLEQYALPSAVVPLFFFLLWISKRTFIAYQWPASWYMRVVHTIACKQIIWMQKKDNNKWLAIKMTISFVYFNAVLGQFTIFFSSCKYSEKRRERERARGGKNIICHWIINQCKSVGKQQLFFFPPQPPFQRRAHSEIHPRIVQPKPINHACVGRRPCNATNAQ